MSHPKTKRKVIKTKAKLEPMTSHLHSTWPLWTTVQSVQATPSRGLCRLFFLCHLLEFGDILWYCSAVGASARKDMSTEQSAVWKLMRNSSWLIAVLCDINKSTECICMSITGIDIFNIFNCTNKCKHIYIYNVQHNITLQTTVYTIRISVPLNSFQTKYWVC